MPEKDAKIPTPNLGNELSRLFIGCLLFKLGGEIHLTAEEIDEIKKSVGGVQIFLHGDDGFILRVKTPESIMEHKDKISPL